MRATAGLAALMEAGAAPDALLDATIAAAEKIALGRDAVVAARRARRWPTRWPACARRGPAEARSRAANGPALLAAMLEPEIIRPALRPPSAPCHLGAARSAPAARRSAGAGRAERRHLAARGRDRSVDQPADARRPRPAAAGAAHRPVGARLCRRAGRRARAADPRRARRRRADRAVALAGAARRAVRLRARQQRAAAGIHPARPAQLPRLGRRARSARHLHAVAASRAAAAARGAADAALGVEHRAMAARSLWALCAAHPGPGARSIRWRPSWAPPTAARRCTMRSTSSCERIPPACCPPTPSAQFEALGEKHLGALLTAPAERAFWWPRFQRLARWFVGHRERAPRAPAPGCWRAKPTARSPSGRPPGRCASRRAPTASTRSSPAPGRSSTTRPAACPRPRTSSKPCSRPSSCSRRQWPSAAASTGIKGRRDAVQLAYWQANGLGDGGKVSEIKDSERLVPRDAGAGRAAWPRISPIPPTPYAALPWPEYIPHFNDYAHLERDRRMVDRGRRRGMTAAFDPLALASEAQRRATTPGHSAWVEANAGTGKTKVLTDRVTRLLLDGVQARAHPLPHLHQGRRGRDAQPAGQPARALGAGRPRPRSTRRSSS